MILWTIRTQLEWETLQKQGVLRTDRELSNKYGWLEGDPWVDYCYRWICKKMRETLPWSPKDEDALPLWGWYHRYSAAEPKPDLRTEEYRYLKNHLRLEIEIDDDLVLLSNFDLWNWVLNNWYLPVSELEWDAHFFEMEFNEVDTDKQPLENRYYQSRIEKTWEKIFDLDLVLFYSQPLPQKMIQATFWELRLEQVRNVKETGSWCEKIAA